MRVEEEIVALTPCGTELLFRDGEGIDDQAAGCSLHYASVSQHDDRR